MTAPLSPNNPRIKRLRRLINDRSARRDEQMFVVDGPRALATYIAGGGEVATVFCDDPSRPDLAFLASWPAIDVAVVDRGVLDSMADTRGPQGIVGVGPIPTTSMDDIVGDAARSIVVVLDGVGDPGNVGAIVRVAAARGAAVVVSSGCADHLSPRAVRASAGTLALTDVAGEVPLGVALAALGAGDISIAATTMSGGRAPRDLAVGRRLAVVLGSEGSGVSAETMAAVDQLITIPMHPGVESLNVAVTAGIVLYGLDR